MLRQAVAADIPGMHWVRLAVKENQLRSTAITEADAVGNKTNGNIWALFVAPAHEGRGYGRQLHDVMVGWLNAEWPGTLWLTTEPGTRAERFYEKSGWLKVGSTASGEVRYERDRNPTTRCRAPV